MVKSKPQEMLSSLRQLVKAYYRERQFIEKISDKGGAENSRSKARKSRQSCKQSLYRLFSVETKERYSQRLTFVDVTITISFFFNSQHHVGI